ncbi:hypothetical protein LI095_10365, partial [Veillonella atypica]|uniref:histidine kinase dimerization/phospho-acceptor domain-containing protein n=1 Tax=Veillonella atypica TaxID=39777 RepID=UPI001D05FA51
PLSSIKWQIDALLEKEFQVSPEEFSKSIKVIKHSNEKMANLIGDLLDVNRIEDRELELTTAIFSLAELTEEIVKIYESSAAASNL